jgi:hypothetical protein
LIYDTSHPTRQHDQGGRDGAFPAGSLDRGGPVSTGRRARLGAGRDQDRTHLAHVTVGAQTPEFGNAALRAVASNWRISGILNTRSGSWLTVTSGRDNVFNGMANQRVDQVSDDVYGPKTLMNYLNPAAFGQPAAGTFGTHQRNSIKGPWFHKVDLALSRLVSLAATRTIELRLEVFNLFNTFNWGLPNANFGSGTFGRITTMTGDPRIMQFGIKYGF